MTIERGTREYLLAGAALFFGSLVMFGAEYCVQPIIPLFTAVGGLAGRLILSALTDWFDWRLALMVLGGLYIGIGLAFLMTLPTPKHVIDLRAEPARPRDFIKLLRNWRLVCVYLIATLAMGAFVCTYNFISYTLLAPPYSLTQTQVGLVYMLFLVGTFASTVMGRLSDRLGNGRTLLIALAAMMIGVLTSLASPLALKLIGIALLTYGFFGAHSAAAAWAGRLDDADKARISSMYMLFYYFGASVIGTLGGKFLMLSGWTGIVMFLTVELTIALMLSAVLIKKG